MNIGALHSILLVLSTVHAFQYNQLAQYIDEHQEDYVEVLMSSSAYKEMSLNFCKTLLKSPNASSSYQEKRTLSNTD